MSSQDYAAFVAAQRAKFEAYKLTYKNNWIERLRVKIRDWLNKPTPAEMEESVLRSEETCKNLTAYSARFKEGENIYNY